MKKSLVLGLALLVGGAAQAAQIVEFNAFNIRNNNGVALPGRISAPWDADLYVQENTEGDGFVASTPQAGQKVGYGTSAFDGFQLNDLATVNWDKLSGPANLTAYLNIWVTDNNGNYAVIASENNYRGTAFNAREEWKIFEYGGSAFSDGDPLNDFNWLFDSGMGSRDGAQYLNNSLSTGASTRIQLSELSNDIVVFSGMPYGAPGVGSGAPQGGYGFNIIWGDTAANFTNGNPYEVDNVTLTWDSIDYQAGAVVPVPAAAPLGLLGMGLVAFLRRRKKQA